MSSILRTLTSDVHRLEPGREPRRGSCRHDRQSGLLPGGNPPESTWSRPMTVRHAAVWIDHKEAKVFHIAAVGFEVSQIKAPHHHVSRNADYHGSHAGSERYFHDVAEALKDVEEVIIVGPSSAKLDFIRYVH